MIDYSVREPVPNPDAMNTGLNSPGSVFMVELFGQPRKHLTDDCAAITNPELKKKIVFGVDVGPFNASGLAMAVESLQRIFEKVKHDNPELYSQVSTAGMLCCRRIRQTHATPSNHAFGSAIDIKINGRLDGVGDGLCQIGLHALYGYFHNEGWYWGAEYKGPREDAMHFEVARQTLEKWFGV